jgi:hypothetical protein
MAGTAGNWAGLLTLNTVLFFLLRLALLVVLILILLITFLVIFLVIIVLVSGGALACLAPSWMAEQRCKLQAGLVTPAQSCICDWDNVSTCWNNRWSGMPIATHTHVPVMIARGAQWPKRETTSQTRDVIRCLGIRLTLPLHPPHRWGVRRVPPRLAFSCVQT